MMCDHKPSVLDEVEKENCKQILNSFSVDLFFVRYGQSLAIFPNKLKEKQREESGICGEVFLFVCFVLLVKDPIL